MVSVAPPKSLKSDWAWCAAFWMIVLLFDASGADAWFIRLYGTASGFPWRDHWLTSDVMHRGGRVASWLLFGVTVALTVRPWQAIAMMPRRHRVWWVACTVLCLLLIPLIKRISLTSCPWDLRDFGGPADWVSHWNWGAADGGSGRCFPSGHASGAFGFLAGYFALREYAPRAARLWLGAVMVLGMLFGWAQLMRGAHYLSHALWTAAICWSVTLLTFHTTLRSGWIGSQRLREP